MDINVLKQVKKRGPKKLRGVAAVAAKKRAIVRERKAKLPQFDAQHPYRVFALYRIEDMGDQIDEHVSKLESPELIRVFHMLKNQIPWSLVKPFFKEFDMSGRSSIVSFFNEFYTRPSVQEQVLKMRALINRRKFTSLVGKYILVKPTTINERRLKLIENDPLFGNRILEGPTRRIIPMFGPGEILSKREREYRRAPWMYEFIKEPIRGFVVRNDPRVSKYITSEYGDGWFNVSPAWYKDGSNNKRIYYPNIVGYRTVKGPIIIETREMFIASKNAWEKIIETEFEIANSISYSIAHTMLEENNILPKTAVEGVLASIDRKSVTNQDIARELSKILVFLQRLIKDPQVHHFRIKNSFYNSEDIINLDRYMMLPEVYRNPRFTKDEVDELERMIKIKRRLIENDFYARLSTPYDPFTRRQQFKKRNEFKYINTNSRSNCPVETDDIIYYEEDGQMYCFNRADISGQTVNPFTGNPFRLDFLKEIDRLPTAASPPRRALSRGTAQIAAEPREFEEPQEVIEQPEPEIEIPKRKIRDKAAIYGIELAPGLFQKLREFISSTKCAQCSKQIYNPTYKSIHENEKVYFCGSNCFDKYKF